MSDSTPDIQVRFHKIRDVESCDGIETTFVNDSLGRPFHLHRAEWSANLPSAVLARFRCELEVLKELECEALLTPSEIQFTKNGCWVVCPATDTTALTVLMSELSLRELLSVTDQFLDILRQVHEAGLFVRCVRPQDIFLSDRTGELRMLLAGCPPLRLLSAVNEQQSSMSILTYSAPEALGALEHEFSSSSDLYSLGILLHQCLTGKLPFPAETARELLFHHVATPAPSVCDVKPAVPRSLGQIVQRLLRKHPVDRYQTAVGLQHDIRQVMAQLDDDSVVVVPGVGDHRQQLIEPAHVGREQEVATLEKQLKAVKGGGSSSVLLTASSGVGKSRLLQELKLIAERSQYQVLIGQGQNQVGLPPLATLGPALSHCVEALRSSEELVAKLRPELQDFTAELNATVPKVADALKLSSGDRNDRQLSDRRIAVALATLLGHLATPQSPVLFVLDDAQWADDLTLTILDCWELIAPANTALVVSSRPTDALADRLRSNINFSAEINLTSLSRRQSDLLLASMAGELPEEILTTVWEMASGNPFISSAVLRGFVESAILSSVEGRWIADEEQLRNLQMSGEAAQVLKQRLFRLPNETRRLLAFGAVLGKEFSVEVAATLAQQPIDVATVSLEQAVSLYLIWLKGDSCQFVHDQIRESVLQSLGVTEQREMHLTAARYLSTHSPDSHFEIAHHFDHGGAYADALPHARAAAHAARSHHALEIAERQFRIALRGLEAIGTEPDFDLLEGLGSVLILQGRYQDAEPILVAASKCADSDMAQAEVGLKLGELAFKQDEKKKAVQLCEEALLQIGGQLPRGWMMPFYAFKEMGRQLLHTVLPGRFVRGRTREATDRDRMQWRLYSRLAYGYWYIKGMLPVLYVHLRSMNLAETCAPTAELAQAYSEHAPAMSLIPLSHRGIAYGRRSLEIRTELEDVWGQGQSLNFLAVALYAAGRYEECIDVGRRSVRILEQAGDVWEKHQAQYQVAASLYRLGRFTEAVQLAREAYDSGAAYGDDQVCANIIEVWARATNGDIPEEIIQREVERPRTDIQAIGHVMLAQGVQFMSDGELQQAVDVFQKGIDVTRAGGISNCYTAPLHAWKATALRTFLEDASPVIRKTRQKTIRRHRRAARIAMMMAVRFRSELPHALRELAWSFVFQNKIRRAMLTLNWSIRAARIQNARWEQLQGEQMLQQIRVECGLAGASQALGDVHRRMSAFRNEQLPKRVPTSFSLVDRFESLLDAGRAIASALEPDDIITATRTASQQLLRSDFCRVVPLDADSTPRNVSDSVRTLIVKSLRNGGSVAADAPTRDYRSLLCCPVMVRGEATAVLMVGNTEVRDLFGENEERIASYITTICGTALENAEGFSSLKDLNANLEDIVSERTAAVEARSYELQKTADNLREAQVELAAARDAAEVANDAKTDFLAHMSHEIRTPIGAVLGFTELLLHGEQSLHAEQREHLTRVHSNGMHLQQLLNDLLDLSRIEAGEVSIEVLKTRPFGLLYEIMSSLQSRAIDKGLALSLEVVNVIPESIQTDPTRLRQVITNLVGNAIKFTESGAVELRISTDVAAQKLKIDVCDSGVGIPPESQTDVFEPFKQADQSVNRKFGGTGLGLPISRRLTQALGGDIALTSEVGVGSTFSVTLATGDLADVRLLTPAEALEAEPHSSVDDLTEVDLTGTRILVADDMDANRAFFTRTLESVGAETVTANDGREAVEIWKQGGFDLILMDMRMPVMDGHDAVIELRRLGAELPIVALTANGHPEDESRCQEEGCSGYLSKPISMDALRRGVADHLGITTPRLGQTETTDSREVIEHLGTSVPAEAVHGGTEQPGNIVFRGIEVPDDPFFADLAADLIAKITQSIPDATAAVARQNAAPLIEQGHWMKGTGGTVGLPVLTSLGASLEDCGHDQDFDSARRILDELTQAIQYISECLAKK